MKNLSMEFKMTFLTGDQDWWAMLSWKKPELFYILPCRFNKQMSLQYLRKPWEEIFDSYHNCSSTKAQTMIFHRFVMTMMMMMMMMMMASKEWMPANTGALLFSSKRR